MIGKYFILALPLIFSYIVADFPELSYFIAWLGSFYIYFLTLSGFVKPLPSGMSAFQQANRPLVLFQLIFTGYMACTSVFYFLSQLGYQFFTKHPAFIPDYYEIENLSRCQKYYLTGHFAFVVGILSQMNYDFKPKYTVHTPAISVFMIKFSLASTAMSFVLRFVPGMTQVQNMFVQLSSVSAIISLCNALPEKKAGPLLASGGLFGFSYINAIASGWKEAILIPLIMLGMYLYPNYKRIVLAVGPIVLACYFYLIPTFNGIIREQVWTGKMNPIDAASYAFDQIISGQADIAGNNWSFLTSRLSEISMFSKYLEAVPNRIDFYGFQIVVQGLENIIPRVFYPNKPITEQVVMARVYDCGIVSNLSTVSAKPPFIVDCYLSAGFVGIFIGCFIFGFILSWLSVRAEYLYGSYAIGSALIFTGLCSFWRGNCFEFMFNSVFWSIVVLFAIHRVGLIMGMVKKIEQ